MSDKNWNQYWKNKKILNIELFKVSFLFKKYLWMFFKLKFPKMKSQKFYWNTRGTVYKDEFFQSNYDKIEIFYQNYFIQILKKLKFESVLELGSGFGWNLKRINNEFKCQKISGIDFSKPQIENSKAFLNNEKIDITEGDIENLPYENNSFDLLFTFGVMMNVHKSKVDKVIEEAIRVSKKYIIHVEPNSDYYTKELRSNRIFKTNIVSHNLLEIYKSKGVSNEFFSTYKNFVKDFEAFKENIEFKNKRWEPIEDCSKYTFLVFKKN